MKQKTIFRNVTLLPEYGFGSAPVNVTVEGALITAVGKEIPDPAGAEVIEGKGNLLMPAFYNAHCHAAMTLFRGYGEDLPLQRWLTEKIFPAEDRLTYQSVKVASELAIAEMIRGGVVSFTDMYMFEDATAEVVLSSGVKANLSRCIVSFDPDIDMRTDSRMSESLDLVDRYHGAGEGRLLIDLSLHAEYTNVPKCVTYVGEYAKEHALRLQIHLSETEKEHKECLARHGKTPAAFFRDLGAFDAPTTAAHCVWVEDDDIAILAEKGVTAAHNPVSNLKLGSGVMPLRKLLDAGVNVALGTDGVASNNRLDILREMQTAAILHKGVNRDPAITVASEMIPLATVNGARSQGREDCGRVKVGFRADLILLDRDAPHNIPSYGDETMLAYSAERGDVLLTMCDGRILYREGTYTTIDMERLRAEARETVAHYFD